MEKLSDLKINLDGLHESSRYVEKLLKEIILNKHLTGKEVRQKASLCLEAVNRYTGIANENVRLLNEQAQFLMRKVQSIQQNTPEINPPKGEDPDFDIN